ncbi:unnamed protein product [Lactuca virosa]|uniref:Uncharacterized protein n=1 Tax=Lactuca virosa TaxID=75947 RepID=A0AAU9NRA6_9ASTR|nr:unnamed protein product [Lactuca virosa]
MQELRTAAETDVSNANTIIANVTSTLTTEKEALQKVFSDLQTDHLTCQTSIASQITKLQEDLALESVQASSVPIAIVAEEHVAPARPNLSSSFKVSDSDNDNDTDDDVGDSDDDDDDDSDSDDGVDFRIYVPPKEPVSKDVDTPAETEKDSTARKPPQEVHVISNFPSESDKIDSDASLVPRKRRHKDPRLGVFISEPVQSLSPTVDATQVSQDDQSPSVEPIQVHDNVQSPIFGEGLDFLANKETFASGSSSAPPPPEHDVASVKLAMILAFQDSISQSKGKGLSIGSKQGSDEDSHQIISELKQEINSIKDAKISELQANLGGITALFFDLKQRLLEKFVDDFQPLSAEGEKISSSTSNPVNPPSQCESERVVRPAPDTNLDTFLSSGPSFSQERREKQARIEELKGKMLVMKRSDQNVSGKCGL